MPDALDQLTPSGDALDLLTPTASTPVPSTWDTIKDAAGRAGQGLARGLGIPTSLDQVKAIANQPFDWSTLAGPGPALVKGTVQTLQDAKKRIDAGDVIGGGVQGATTLLPLLGMTEGAGVGEAKLPPGIEVPEPTIPSVKKLTEAINPGKNNVRRFQDAAATAVPALKEFEPTVGPISLKNWSVAQQLAEAKRANATDSFIQPAVARGATIDGNTIANAKIDAIPPAWQSDPRYRAQYTAALDDANSLRRPISLLDAYNSLKLNNANLTNFYKQSEDGQFAARLSGTPVADWEAEAKGLRQAIAKTVDPEHDGAQFAQIRGEQSKLITFRQHTEGLENKLQGQYTPTTAQKIGQGLSDAGSIYHGNYREATAYKMRQAPSLDDMFQQAFKNWNGPDLPETPTANPSKYQAIPPSRQLGPGAIRLPGADTSGVKITTGKPLQQYAPVELTHPSGSPQFARQYNWNEVLEDPKILAGEHSIHGSTEVGQHRLDLQPSEHGDFLRQLGLDEQ